MSREIKFRAWSKDARKMVDLATITPLALDANMNTQLAMQGGSGLFIPFLPDMPIMQYTGIKDKNGEEIYDGDICRFSIMGEGTLVRIVWLRSAWGFEPVFPDKVHPDDREARAFYRDPFEGDDWPSDSYFEVIGNIHENPELLEGK